jgi:hypothetical protein
MSNPTDLLPADEADEADTKADNKTPIEQVLHDLMVLAQKVDSLTDLVRNLANEHNVDEQTYLNAREALRRCDKCDERCERNHPSSQRHPPNNGAGHG